MGLSQRKAEYIKNAATQADSGALETGGAERDRTADLLNANQALSQLSYCPVIGAVVEVLIQRASWWAEQELHL